ncbi:MAG: hypothetical protein ABFC62_00160 [Clostridiaceae bacterium]|nr:hypothetical protein [Eubacteriales bacterium]
MKRLRLALYTFLQFTWGLPQNLAGLLWLAFLHKQRREYYRGAIVTYYENHPRLARLGCFAIGMFIFMDGAIEQSISRRILVHEYGHTIQSLLFGPLFSLAVGLPSMLWAMRFRKNRSAYREKGVAYSSRYPESGANRWGERATGEQAIDW